MVKKVGLIGWPVAHSISPAMHQAAFQALGLHDWRYELVPIPPDIVRQGLRALRDEGGFIGVNVTIPLKQAVMPYVRSDEQARAVGAVNTIDFRDNSGMNTDVNGFLDDLAAHGISVAGERAIVLGAGGAARAAAYGLARAGAEVIIVNRTFSRAQDLVASLASSAGLQHITAQTLDEAAEQGARLVVNCTSAGMWPHVEETPWIEGVPFPAGAAAYDMVYRPLVTRFMRQVEAGGGQAIGGLGMLVRQGAASFARWTGQTPPLEVMFDAARAALASG